MAETHQKTNAKRCPDGDARHRTGSATLLRLAEHPAYLQLLRSRLQQNTRAFNEHRQGLAEAIETTLAWLASDTSLEEGVRRRLLRLFEQTLAGVRGLEAVIPTTENEALALLDRLEAIPRTRAPSGS